MVTKHDCSEEAVKGSMKSSAQVPLDGKTSPEAIVLLLYDGTCVPEGVPNREFDDTVLFLQE